MKAQTKMLLRLGAGFACFFGGIAASLLLPAAALPCFLLAYLMVGYDVVWDAVRNILKGQVFDENFLMSLATIGAFAIGEYTEGVAVMLFFQVGELFQNYAVNKSRASIATLMDIRPDYANVLRGEVSEEVDPEDVQIGETIEIKPGERVPLDCTVQSGHATLDTSALTGESLPREVSPGSVLYSGSINQNGLLRAVVSKEYADSTVNKILDLVENATDKKSKAEHFITKFARYYTPSVVIAAALLAVLPPLLLQQEFATWVYRALSFLVVSCPCALVISIPLSFFGGIGGASKLGILVKGSNYLEVLAATDTVVFDKTGTLTKGEFSLAAVHATTLPEAELLAIAAHAEHYSNHPIAQSIQRAYPGTFDPARVTDITEHAGFGLCAAVDGKTVWVGNEKMLAQQGIVPPAGAVPKAMLGTAVHLGIAGEYAGYLVITDEVKPDAATAIAALKRAGIAKTVMLTGDAKAIGEAVAAQLGLDEVHTQLLPTDKVAHTEAMLAACKGKLAFVGDGINDAPVLARADVGIAMGGIGSDAAIEAADIVIMTDEPAKIAVAVDIARRTLRIVKQNIAFALGIKLGVLILTAFGLSNMWEAVFADVGVAVLAILNATRMLSTKKYEK
ncbi:MAG: heavy metal translocating P-type ATPase [Faecalibacterium sp.]